MTALHASCIIPPILVAEACAFCFYLNYASRDAAMPEMINAARSGERCRALPDVKQIEDVRFHLVFHPRDFLGRAAIYEMGVGATPVSHHLGLNGHDVVPPGDVFTTQAGHDRFTSEFHDSSRVLPEPVSDIGTNFATSHGFVPWLLLPAGAAAAIIGDVKRPRVLIFDVNETLLDLAGLRSVLAEALGGGEPLTEWFFRLLHGSLVANATDSFRSFEVIGIEALRAVALRQGAALTQEAAADLVAGFRSLPPHADVADALARLQSAGFRLIALSNGSPTGIPAQLTNAGIIDRFEMVVSVEEAGRFKPDPAPYRVALERALVAPEEALMVAAHDWDIIGARAVGIPGAFIARPGVVWTVPHELPELTPANIAALATDLGA